METVRIRDPGWKKVGSGIRDKHPGSANSAHQDGQKNVNQDPDPQQLKMVISHGWCRKREEKEKVRLFEHFLKGFSLYLEARIRIRIRIK
jgi:hypothetical protein